MNKDKYPFETCIKDRYGNVWTLRTMDANRMAIILSLLTSQPPAVPKESENEHER